MTVPSRTFRTLAALMLLAFVATACGSQPATESGAASAGASVAAPDSASPAAEPSAAASEAAGEASQAAEASTAPETSTPAEASAATQPAGDGEPVVVALTDITDQLDPMFSSSLNAASQFEAMFDPLTGIGQDLTLTPGVATEWSASEDGRTWTFKLRDDVKFWDGTQLTADDVKYTIDRMTDPEIGATGNTAYLSNNMQVESTAVVDPTTVTVTTEQPVPVLPQFIHEVGIMSKAHYENLSVEDAAKTPMGSGPYKYVEFVKDDRVVMEANEEWWGGAPAIKQVVWREIVEPSTQVAELLTGGVDIARGVPVAKVAEIEGSADAVVKEVVGGCRNGFVMNQSDPKFQDARVRQALNYAVDWDTINEVIFEGSAPRMVVNVNPPWLNESLSAYPYDVDRATALLTEAGWADSDGDGIVEKDGAPFNAKINTWAAPGSEGLETVTAIVDMYKEIGINAEIAPTERSVGIDQLQNKSYQDMFFLGSCSTFEGQGDISDLEANSASNYGGWSNEEFQTVFGELRTTFEAEQRRELLNQLQELVYNEAPMVFLYRGVDRYGVSNRLNWEPLATGRVHLEGATYK